MRKLLDFFFAAKTEAMKINWPTRQQVVRYTFVVLAVSAGVAAFLGTLDSFFGWLFRRIILGE